MDDPGLTKAKVSRSRAACDPCRLVKQKCDGPSMIPCRRCMLYSLPCTYAINASSSQKKTAKVAASTAASAPSDMSNAMPPLPTPPGQAQLDVPTNNLLHDMAARLRSIESAISALQLSGLSSTTSSSRSGMAATARHPSQSPEDGSSPQSNSLQTGSDLGGDAGRSEAKQSGMGETAVQAINDAVDLLHQVTASMPGLAGYGTTGGSGDSASDTGQAVSSTHEAGLFEHILQAEGWTRADALDRGVMTIEEVDKTFEIFFSRLAPWVPIFPSPAPDTQTMPDAYTPLALRARSPLLFHVVLQATAYFLLPSPGERSKRVYLGLTSIVNELIAPVVVSMSKADMTTDTVRALLLLIMWKPVQHAYHLATSSSPLSSAERHYKNNALSSGSLWLLETHLLRTLQVQSNAPHAFAAAVQHAGAQGRNFDAAYLASEPLAQRTVDDLRLWFWSLTVDVHGALTTGRATQFSGGEAALAQRTSRALAGFNLQASDVRLAAFVELYEIVREGLHSPWACVDGAAASAEWKHEWEAEMDEFNRRIDTWEEDWVDRLKAAFVGGGTGDQRDKIAWNVMGNKHLGKAVLNASVFYRWNRLRCFTATGALSPPVSPPISGEPSGIYPTGGLATGTTVADLTTAEWRFLRTTIDAIERLIFQLSVESRVSVPGKAYDGYRRVRWPPLNPETGLRKPLTVDSLIAESMKTSHDSVSCVGLVYPMILLAKICNSGLARCDLTTLDKPDSRDAFSFASPPPPSPSGEATAVPVMARGVLKGHKLYVLLSLGVAFLEQLAPTPAHPAAIHAKTLRIILKAGTFGQELETATVQAQAEAIRRGRWGGPTSTRDISEGVRLMSAILAQVSPNSPGVNGGMHAAAAAAAPSTLFSSTAGSSAKGRNEVSASETPTTVASLSPPSLAGVSTAAPSFSFAASAATGLDGSVSTASGAADPFPLATFNGGSTTTSSGTTAGSSPGLYPSPPLSSRQSQSPQSTYAPPGSVQAQPPFLGTVSSSFPAFQLYLPPPTAGSDLAASIVSVPPIPSEGAHGGLAMEIDSDALSSLDWAALEKQLGMETGSLSSGFAAGLGVGSDGVSPTQRTAADGASGSLDWMGVL